MPRQLPWKSNGGRGSCTVVKQSSRPTETIRVPDEIEDDFFNDISLESTCKGKARAALDSDGSLSDFSTKPSIPHTKITTPTTLKDRETLSSPSPSTDHSNPHSESMRKGVSKFDLRDDEWMMVEDEFLETAKVFTQNLHIAEYERLKKSIEAKKKEAEVTRPVVVGAKRSVEGTMKERANMQETKQKKAIRCIFAPQDDSSEMCGASYRAEASKAPLSPTTPRSATNRSQDTDSDDLDAQHPPKLKISVQAFAASKIPQRTLLEVSKPTAPSFVEPTLPVSKTSARLRCTPSRMMPFDMLEEYTPSKLESAPGPSGVSRKAQTCISSKQYPKSSSTHSSLQSAQTMATLKSEESFDLLDAWSPSKDKDNTSQEVTGHIAKRRTGGEKLNNEKRERRVTNLDDIPTFLF